MKAVVVASGDLAPGDLRHVADGATLVVAADGGAAALAEAGCRVDRIVGDLDSADPALVERLASGGTRIDRHPSDKDASDAELAVEAALDAGATEIVLLGALGGGRIDHELANVLLLADSLLAGARARIVRGGTTIRAVRGGESLVVDADIGAVVTLLPVGGDADGVSAAGVRWPLEDATLRVGRSRGLSNEVTERGATVRVSRGTLLVVEQTAIAEKGAS